MDGLKHGFGRWKKFTNHSVNIYEGQYANDKKEGFGIFKWASGNKYIGHYKNDKREGIGQMMWTDGSIYIGEWKEGIQHGYGYMYFPDGTVKEGLFEKNSSIPVSIFFQYQLYPLPLFAVIFHFYQISFLNEELCHLSKFS